MIEKANTEMCQNKLEVSLIEKKANTGMYQNKHELSMI